MQVTRKSIFSGTTRTRDLPITRDQMDRFNAGQELVQVIFPDLSPDDREFLLTGVTPEEWDAAFQDSDD